MAVDKIKYSRRLILWIILIQLIYSIYKIGPSKHRNREPIYFTLVRMGIQIKTITIERVGQNYWWFKTKTQHASVINFLFLVIINRQIVKFLIGCRTFEKTRFERFFCSRNTSYFHFKVPSTCTRWLFFKPISKPPSRPIFKVFLDPFQWWPRTHHMTFSLCFPQHISSVAMFYFLDH